MKTICYISHQKIDEAIHSAIKQTNDMVPVYTQVGFKGTPKHLTVMLAPDVMLLDIDGMDKEEAVQAVQFFSDSKQNNKIIVITGSKNRQFILQLVKTDIDGIVEKTANLHISIVEVLENVLQGYFLLPYSVIPYFTSQLEELKGSSLAAFFTKIDNVKAGLSKRETEICYYIRQGLRNKEIVPKLRIGSETLKQHVNHIFKKTGCQNRQELIDKLKQI